MDFKVLLKCNECGTVFLITVIKSDLDKFDLANNYHSVCVSCGKSGAYSLAEIETNCIE